MSIGPICSQCHHSNVNYYKSLTDEQRKGLDELYELVNAEEPDDAEESAAWVVACGNKFVSVINTLDREFKDEMFVMICHCEGYEWCDNRGYHKIGE